MPNTAIWALPYPTQTVATTGPDVPADIKALADSVDVKLTPLIPGLLVDRPPAGVVGRRYYVNAGPSAGKEYLDIGTAWVTIFPELRSDIVQQTHMSDGSVGTNELIDGSVFGTKIPDSAIIARMLADSQITAAKVAAALKPSGGAAAAAEALRALGTTAGTAAAGNDSRLSDQRTPSDGSVTLAKMAFDPATQAELNTANGIRGYIQNGTKIYGSGFTSSRLGTGRYKVNFTTSFSAPPSVQVSQSGPDYINIVDFQVGLIEVNLFNAGTGYADGDFFFEAKPF